MDTLIAAHCLWPESKRDLGFLASICLDTEPWKHTSSETPGYYNGADAANTLAIAYVLNQEIDKFGVRDIFNHEMRQIPAASFLQLQGVKINTETQKKLIAKSASLAAEAKKSLDSLIGKDVNYNSTKQLAQLLYIDLGLPTQYKRRKKASDPRSVTTDAEALNKLARENPHPILELLLSYRKWTKQSQALGKPVSPKGRYHTSYNIAWRQKDEKGKIVEEESGTETGRWSSSASIIEPYGPGNLQNQNKFAREMYEPDEGCVLLQADYVQAEAVVVAYLTGDRKLKDIFRNKEDLHCYTASTMFGVPVESISKESHERRVGKTLRHATNYSAGPAVVAKALDIRITEAKRLLEMYLSVNPLLLVWHNRVKRKLEQDRIIITPMGRKRKFLGRWDDSLFRSAYAFEPQSTVGDLLNASMVDLYEKYGDIINLWMQLHDAIYTTPQDNHDSVKFTMEKKLECMIRELDVEGDKMIIDVDFSVGRNWKDMSDARLKDGVVEVKTKTGTNEDNKPIFSWVHYDQWSSDTKLK
jgi:DNA polymerase-1